MFSCQPDYPELLVTIPMPNEKAMIDADVSSRREAAEWRLFFLLVKSRAGQVYFPPRGPKSQMTKTNPKL
jgi:hypothetical protein